MNREKGFNHFLKPGWIGRMEVKNRIVMPAMGTNQADSEGFVTDQLKQYYCARALGGAGLIIIENCAVDFPGGKPILHGLAIDHDKYIPGLAVLANTIHEHNTKTALQLVHAGSNTKYAITTSKLIAPSAIDMRPGETPEELSIAGIEELIAKWARSAERAKHAGFDAVEIHASHAFLISEFLSSAWNKRHDEYGGTLKAKARLLIEVIEAVKGAVGNDFPVLCRLSGQEYGIKDGITLDETKEVARLAERAGADALHISAWGVGAYSNVAPTPRVPGGFVHLAEAIKKEVDVPVIGVGGFSYELAEKTLSEGRVDFIAMGRALIADPTLPNKVVRGELEDITPCIMCNNCYATVGLKDKPISCTVNPVVGKELKFSSKPAKKVKRVLVVGGGPAGMEVSMVAALRGHEVVLRERDAELGGGLILASEPPRKERIGLFTSYLRRQILKLGVRVELGREVTLDEIHKMNPDAIVIATGALPELPDIRGLTGEDLVPIYDLIYGSHEVDETVLVIGGNIVGCEIADYLGEKGRAVTIVTEMQRLAPEMVPTSRRELLDSLAKRKVNLLPGVKFQDFSDKGLSIIDKQGFHQTVRGDTILAASYVRPGNEFFEEIKAKYENVYCIGDCVIPGGIMAAVADGFRVGQIL